MKLPRPRDAMRGFLVLFLLAAFQLALFALFKWEVPAGNKEIVIYMLGQLSGFVGAGIIFYFGTTQSSREKTDAISEIARHEADRPTGEPDDPVTVKRAPTPSFRETFGPRPGDSD